MTEALQKFFDRYFEARRKKGGEVCKGEEVCAETGPLRDKSRPIETICASCTLLPTKPSNIPAHIAVLAAMAFRMQALFDSGAAALYPNFFTPLEWEAFLTLKFARAKDQEKDFQTEQKDQARQEQMAKLMQLSRGQ